MLKEFRTNADADTIDNFLENFDHHSEFYQQNYFDVIERITSRKIGAFRSICWDDGFNVASSYDMIRKIANQPDVFTNRYGFRVVPKTVLPVLHPSDLDGADHATLRQILNPWFSPRKIAEFRESVQNDVDTIMAELRSKGSWDWTIDFAQPVTGRVTMRLLGLPDDEWEDYALPIHNAAFCLGSVESRVAGGMAFAAKVKGEVGRLAGTPDEPGLIPYLARTEIAGTRLNVDEIEKAVLNIIIGGLDTTQATFSCAAVYLARNPGKKQELRDHPERLRAATMEFIRIFSSAPMTGRYNSRDVEIDGHLFPEGESTLLFWPAGNFDPAFVERPMEVDFTRSASRNVTFAAGPHSCLGQHLSKMELEMMLKGLVETDFELIEEEVDPAKNLSAVMAYLNVPSRLLA